MGQTWLTAIGLVLVLEGLPLLLAPGRWRGAVARISAMRDGQVRFIGLGAGLIGLLLLIGSLLKSPLEFGASVSLAAVSFTPIALLETGLLIGFGYPVHTITLFIAGLVALGVAPAADAGASAIETTRVSVS